MTVELNSKKTNGSKILRFNFLSGVPDTEGNSDFLDFWSHHSWSDYDTIIIGTSIPSFSNNEYTINSHGAYSLYNDTSTKLAKQMLHIKTQLTEQLQANKRIIIVLDDLKEYVLIGTEHKKYIDSTHSGNKIENYWVFRNLFYPSSKHIGKQVYNYNPTDEITKKFIETSGVNLSYAIKLPSGMNNFIPLFKDNNGNILGGIARNNVSLPVLLIPKLVVKSVGNSPVLVIRNVEKLIELYNSLCTKNEKETGPDWVHDVDFKSINEVELIREIETVDNQIREFTNQKKILEDKVSEIDEFKRLLYSNGKLLEEEVLRCLKLLGFAAKNFDNGENEFDAVFESEEGRLIGEVEGRDNKAIAIGKFDQLIRNITRDQKLRMESEDDEPPEKAKPVLFGNGFRCTEPSKRDIEFTKHCISHAKDNKAALIKTSDLYQICCYLHSNEDENYAKECRQAIMNTAGEIVIFPSVPNNDLFI